MSLIRITDNQRGRHYSSFVTDGAADNVLHDLRLIADVKIGQLTLEENPNLLVFPRDWDCYGDRLGDSSIISLDNEKLSSGNIMGFVGVNDTQLKINSRFARDDEEDYFLHYMLQKVFAINLFDLKHAVNKESVFDFLPYLFPYFLKKALSQGLFKKYQEFHQNDPNVKGVVVVNRHIRENIPFRGKISYTYREHSYDNEITQLIRHTIEFIRGKSHCAFILKNDKETQVCVSQIMQATSSYKRKDRERIIQKNLRPIQHPYYFAYTALQRICLQILRSESIKFGYEKNKVYGVLFDGAWLWEEYLATILKEVSGVIHPKNRVGEYGIQIYKGSRTYFPDFYIRGAHKDGSDSFVLDAKYKRLSNNPEAGVLEEERKSGFSIQREDLFQMISYMHVLPAMTSALLYPLETANHHAIKEDIKELHGLGGKICGIGIPIPQKSDFNGFSKLMKVVESELKEVVNNLKNQVVDSF